MFLPGSAVSARFQLDLTILTSIHLQYLLTALHLSGTLLLETVHVLQQAVPL